MSYTFTAEVLGVAMNITGDFEEEEYETLHNPRIPASFLIEEIEHKGENLEVDAFPDCILDKLEKESFKQVKDDYEESRLDN